MLKKSLCALLMALVLNVSLAATALSQDLADNNSYQADEMRSRISEIGRASDAILSLRLRDGGEVTGYLSGTGPATCVINNPETGAATTISYASIRQVKPQGNSLSTKAKVGIAIGVAVAVLVVVAIAHRRICNEALCR